MKQWGTPVVVTASTAGGKWTADDSPYLPMTPDAMIEDLVGAERAGATVAHLHARDETGRPCFDPDIMDYIVRGLRERTELVMQVSTGNLPGDPEVSLRAFLGCAPELASFNLKDEPEVTRLRAGLFRGLGVRPVIEAFDGDMVAEAARLLDEGLFVRPLMFELVFPLEEAQGPVTRSLADLLERVAAVEELDGAIWSLTRGAEHRLALAAAALGLGGWVRSGLEDSLVGRDGLPARSSGQLVLELRELCESIGRRVADAAETRALLGITGA